MFLAPALLIFGFAIIYPVFYGIRLSFYSLKLADIRNAPVFSGLGNFIELFQNSFFLESLRATLTFTVGVLIAELLLGITLALLLEEKLAGIRIFRTIFIAPIMIAPIVVGVVWRFMYDRSFGIINYLLSLIGVEPKLWLADPDLAMLAIIISDIWQWTPFVFLLILAGLQGVPRELLDAGKIDGANYIQNLFRIKLPLISQIIVLTGLLRLIDAIRGLVVMYVMTFGGPGLSTEILSLHLYKTAFVSQRLGRASAIGVIMTVIIAIMATIIMLRTKENKI